MIPIAANNFFTDTPTLIEDNYHICAIKMKAYIKRMSLWEVVENPTLMELKKYEEDLVKKPKTLTYIHSAISNAVFTSIMTCESPKEAWDKLKEDFEDNNQIRLMQILNHKNEFEIKKMK